MDAIAQHCGLYDESENLEWADKVIRVFTKTGGGLVTGPHGNGKSVLIKKLQVHLTSLDEPHVTCAYTHAAARLIGGSTVPRLLHFNKRLHDAWIFIDEVSLLPIDTLGQISRWEMIGGGVVMFGDFDGQFEAFKDRWSNVSYDSVPNSELIQSMCNGRRFHMQVYKRGIDQNLSDRFCSMYVSR